MLLAFWTSHDIAYLEEHAGDGAASVARALGRSVGSVKMQAHRFGISLRERWDCPKCGQVSFRPLDRRTGWCRCCTIEEHQRELLELERVAREEAERHARAHRARNASYNRKRRAGARVPKRSGKR